MVKNLDGKNHQLTILNLLYPIDEKDSYKKVKRFMDSLFYSVQSGMNLLDGVGLTN